MRTGRLCFVVHFEIKATHGFVPLTIASEKEVIKVLITATQDVRAGDCKARFVRKDSKEVARNSKLLNHILKSGNLV